MVRAVVRAVISTRSADNVAFEQRRGSLPPRSRPTSRLGKLKITPSLDTFLSADDSELYVASYPTSPIFFPYDQSPVPDLSIGDSESDHGLRRSMFSPRHYGGIQHLSPHSPTSRAAEVKISDLEEKLSKALNDVQRLRVERATLVEENAKVRRSAEHAQWSLRRGEKNWDTQRDKFEEQMKQLQADLSKLTSDKVVLEDRLKEAQEPWILAEHSLKRKIAQMQLELDMRARESKSLKDSVRRVQQYGTTWRKQKDEALEDAKRAREELKFAHEALVLALSRISCSAAVDMAPSDDLDIDALTVRSSPQASPPTPAAAEHVSLAPSSLAGARPGEARKKRGLTLDRVPEHENADDSDSSDDI